MSKPLEVFERIEKINGNEISRSYYHSFDDALREYSRYFGYHEAGKDTYTKIYDLDNIQMELMHNGFLNLEGRITSKRDPKYLDRLYSLKIRMVYGFNVDPTSNEMYAIVFKVKDKIIRHECIYNSMDKCIEYNKETDIRHLKTTWNDGVDECKKSDKGYLDIVRYTIK